MSNECALISYADNVRRTEHVLKQLPAGERWLHVYVEVNGLEWPTARDEVENALKQSIH